MLVFIGMSLSACSKWYPIDEPIAASSEQQTEAEPDVVVAVNEVVSADERRDDGAATVGLGVLIVAGAAALALVIAAVTIMGDPDY